MRRWMSSLLAVVLAMGTLLGAPTPTTPGDAAARFEAANRLTAEGKYSEGAAAYDALAADGRTSAALEYNRAQARLKAGQFGSAWAHLALANRLNPRDSAIRLATEQLAPRVPAGVGSGVVGSWTDRLTLNEWAGLALFSVWVLAGLLFAVRFAPAWKPRLWTPLWVVCGLTVISSALLGTALWSRWQGPNAIVLRPDATVRVSPLDEARTAFSLAEGSEVRRRNSRGDWVMIEEPVSRRFGWMKRSEVQVLPFR